jgi:putative protein kinase ArgK-like GTPase of G3E family
VNSVQDTAANARVTTVTGPSGIAKSSFIKFVAQRFYDRDLFKDGVLFIELTEKTKVKDLMNHLCP